LRKIGAATSGKLPAKQKIKIEKRIVERENNDSAKANKSIF
jgi:hypothetical protein